MSLPEDYLPNDEPNQGPIPVRARAANTPAAEPFTGATKYIGQFARGATLGLGGDPYPPSGLAQTVTEMAGTLLPYQGLSMVTAPLIGAAAGMRALSPIAPLLQRYPVIQGAAADAAAGGIGGAIHAKATGGDVLTESLEGAGLNAAARLAWAAWMRKNPNPTPQQALAAVQARAAGQLPPSSPGLSPAPPGPGPGGPGGPAGPGIVPGATARGARAPWARVTSNVVIEPDTGGLPGGVTAPRIPTARPPMDPLALPAPGGPGEQGLLGDIVEGIARGGPKATGIDAMAPVQGELPLGYMPPSQLYLPMNIIPSGRVNRYATPTRYKGAYPTPELAAIESDAIALRAIEEGAQSVRVTTSVVPKNGGPATGGIIRVYHSEGGRAVLASETSINQSAVKSASVGASPMRRVNPDWFDVRWDERLGSDVLVPRSGTVEAALDMAKGIDPLQTTFPLSPTQTSWLASHEGRAIREKMDVRSKHLTADDVLRMSEEDAKKALLEPDVAPPMKTVGIVEPSEEALKAQSVLTDLGVTEGELGDFLQGMPFNLPQASKARMLTQWLQSKCGPGPTGPAGGV